MLLSQKNLSATKIVEPRWEPHYRAKFTQAQLDSFAADKHQWVDTRGLRTRLNNEGIEVVLDGNPMNDGARLLCKAGYFVDLDKGGIPIDFHIWSITIPLGLGKLAVTLKREIVTPATKQGEMPTYRVLLF